MGISQYSDGWISNNMAETRSRRRRERTQTITPEEPEKFEGNRELGGERTVDESREGTVSDEPEVAFMPGILQQEYKMKKEMQPSLKSTRLLEMEISRLMSELQKVGQGDELMVRIIALMNRSLSAISHWSLQAQLAQWESKVEKDERFLVEKNLMQKEVEYFKRRFLESEKQIHEQHLLLGNSPSKKSRKFSEAPATPTTLLSPKRVTKPKKSQNQPQTPVLTLVENTKQHPRLKRKFNDEAKQDLMRVFHLEKR